MKINSVGSVGFTLAVAIVIFLLLRERTPFGKDNTSFATVSDKEITGIEFNDGSSALSLRNKDGNWFVNGKYEARPGSIDFIVTILKEMEIKSPVSPELFKAEITDKGIRPVKVKITGDGRTLKSFLVYKTASNAFGNIMKLREKSKPFIVYVPGKEVEIGSAFTMNALFWQPYTAFNLLPSEISSVTLENNADPGSSFRIINSDSKFRLLGNSEELAGWDTSLVKRYLSYFTHVPFESWALDLDEEKAGNIEAGEPLYRIVVEKSDGGLAQLVLWERSAGEGGTSEKDTDRLWARLDDNPKLCIVRYVDIDPLLKKRSYFFGQ
jgi:hypothetical protein